MKSVVAAIAAVLAALVLAGMLGVASAEAPTGTPQRTVSVGGVARVPVAQNADAATATAAYRQGMAGALTDGQSKAEFLAGKGGVTLGAVQTITEGGGFISCTGEEENGYAEYQGEQPDFASPPNGGPVRAVAAPRSAPGAGSPVAKHRRRKKAPAKKAAAATCRLTAEVSLVYTIG